MSKEEKEAILELKHFTNETPYWKQEEYSSSEVDSYIKIVLNLIEKQQKENKILKDVFYKIRDLTSPYIVWYDYFTNCYNLRDCTKQEIYRNFSKIREIVYGNYTLLYNDEALKQLIKDKIKEKEDE